MMVMLRMPIVVPVPNATGLPARFPLVGVIEERRDPDTGAVFYRFTPTLPKGPVEMIDFFASGREDGTLAPTGRP